MSCAKKFDLLVCSFPGGLINVKFRGREVADFPRSSFDDLVTDPACEWITDDASGEILFYRD